MNCCNEEVNWINQIESISLKKKTSIDIIFRADRDLTELVDRITGSCGCISNPRVVGDTIVVRFKSGSFPKHLEMNKYYTSNKNVYVHYVDGTRQMLHIKAKITQ